MRRARELDRLCDLFCVVYANSIGGLREAIAIVLAEDRKCAKRARLVASRAGISRAVPDDVLHLVVDTVASARGVSREAILGTSQQRNITQARHESWVILLDRGYTTRAVGAAFDKEFSGVAMAAAKFRATLAADAGARARVGWLTSAKREANAA